jgi:hypothetical protein
MLSKIQKNIFIPQKFVIRVVRGVGDKNKSSILLIKTQFLNLAFIASRFLHFFFLRFNLLLVFKITEKKKQNVINFFLIKLLLLFRELSSPVYNKLKIFGVGFSINVRYNCIIFQAGTTNVLSFTVPRNIVVNVLGKKSTILLIC